MNPTPRTDAAVLDRFHIKDFGCYVSAAFARNLEHELTAALKDVAELRADLAAECSGSESETIQELAATAHIAQQQVIKLREQLEELKLQLKGK